MAKTKKQSWVVQAYSKLIQGENSLRHPLMLLIRLYWGSLLAMAGIGKWANIQGVTEFFTSLSIPFPLFMAYFVGFIEFFGGISLIIGLFTRISTIFITIVLCVAVALTYHDGIIHLLTNPEILIKQDPFLYLYATLIILAFGPGFFSLDYWLEKKLFKTGS